MSDRAPDARADLAAGLVLGVAAVPDAIASAVLAGVNPVHGLVALMVGLPVAALTTGSVFMVVTTTSAMAMTARAALAGVAPEDRAAALALVTVVAGLVQIALGLLRAGFLTHFISNAVMTGFFTGVAVLIVVGQLPDLAGSTAAAAITPHTLVIGIATIALILSLERTRVAVVGMLLALATSALLVVMLGWRDVVLVGAQTPIPSAVPSFVWPDFASFRQFAFAAVALASIGLVQGAGIGQTVPNPDGRFPDPSRDFTGQGLANVASGFLGGMPIGGSLSSTSLSVGAGAQSRRALLAATVSVIVIVAALGGFVEQLPAAALAAVLVIAGARSIRADAIAAVWRTSRSARIAMLFTFVATLLMAVSDAILLGVAVSFALELYRSADRARLVELVPGPAGRLEERSCPARLQTGQITVLMPYGTLSFAGARRFEEDLPDARGIEHAVVILALRGRTELGSTFFRILERYAQIVCDGGGRLMLVEVTPPVRSQLERTGLLRKLGDENVFVEEKALGVSLVRAIAAADAYQDQAVAPAH